jgi:uncharacterized protein
MNELIQDALDYIKDIFSKDYSGHDYYHTFRVLKLAKEIAITENCNIDRVKMIAILHDVDDYKLSPETNKKLSNAKKFLELHKFSKTEIESICDDISKLSFSKGIPSMQLSLEGKIVQDADRLDAIGAIGIARTFAYGGAHSNSIYDPDSNTNSSVSHFYDKLLKLEAKMNTVKGKELAKERNIFMENFLQQFLKEWE